MMLRLKSLLLSQVQILGAAKAVSTLTPLLSLRQETDWIGSRLMSGSKRVRFPPCRFLGPACT